MPLLAASCRWQRAAARCLVRGSVVAPSGCRAVRLPRRAVAVAWGSSGRALRSAAPRPPSGRPPCPTPIVSTTEPGVGQGWRAGGPAPSRGRTRCSRPLVRAVVAPGSPGRRPKAVRRIRVAMRRGLGGRPLSRRCVCSVSLWAHRSCHMRVCACAVRDGRRAGAYTRAPTGGTACERDARRRRESQARGSRRPPSHRVATSGRRVRVERSIVSKS